MTTLPSIDSVRTEVRGLAGGRRKIRFTHVLGVALLVFAFVLAAVAWFVPAVASGWMALAAVIGSLLVAVTAALLLPVDEVAIAKRYDDKVGTKDLLSSSLELGEQEAGAAHDADLGRAFVAAVREDAAQATGKANSRELFPASWPSGLKWLPVPIAVILLAAYTNREIPPEPPPEVPPAVAAALEEGAAWLEDLLNRASPDVQVASADTVERLKNLTEALRDDIDKRDALAELARLASQLDKEKKDKLGQKMELEKNAARLAKGEDAKDARRDMDAGRYREAANKVKKKISELEKELEQKINEKVAKLEIEKLKKRIAKLKELLAELEQLQALGQELSFLLETLEALERIEGRLGELGEYDGPEFDAARLGRLRRPDDREPSDENGQPQRMPSDQAGEGHVKKLLGKAQRALSEGDDLEVKLREGKGKSSYGQVRTANDGSRSRTEFGEYVRAAKRAADDAIYRQNIPVGYREYIRRYFEVMQPDDGANREDR